MIVQLRRRAIGDISILDEINIPILLKRIYIQRGIKNPRELELKTCYLFTNAQFNGIQQAAILLTKALRDKLSIMVVGDFDVDGATSTALVILALKQMGVEKINFLILNRFKDSYGLNTRVVEKVASSGAQIILTVDNGVSSHTAINLAVAKGIPVLVIDHHLPGQTLPNAVSIVNPNLKNCNFQSKNLASVGVAFYLMLALRMELCKSGWFDKNKIAVPKLAKLFDLVALGTVADMVPLDMNNRILVHQGINLIRTGCCRPGIRALVEISNINLTKICASDLGFYISPRLNAAGRLQDMSLSVELLLADNLSTARIIAAKLDRLNKERRLIEQKMFIQALNLCKQIENTKNGIPSGLLLYHQNWHQGVIGIIASQIKEFFYRPVIILAPADNFLLKGSCRSVPSVHIYNLLQILDQLYPNMMLNFGGHAMAAGLTIEQSKLSLFRDSFYSLANQLIKPSMLNKIIWSDGELVGKEISISTAKILREGGPWGVEFTDPLFDGIFCILNKMLIKKVHLKIKLQDISNGLIIDGIIFNINKIILLSIKTKTLYRIAYKLNINYSNHQLQLLIQYIWNL
ncbi:single-stranded-DNA-specific exonuclease RecJ [Candidatus Palibaumannia cicadellinicola]|uniref:Single-stranded-DNA-specific exonuclease RecJ n=1 Tax=Baumannia cicadellinicola subsp. Homalodisca coagulata TaxID=374463 RepID=Q1LTU5_BAUCH|nr:single-stranded-DNA-specific exonuclease RecJ [Candidatus Baumannia cicadellinicola]ABF14237.1 single-stranded-DNA-specific exonuclease RecJ [Baumannia cicadellinicola str. Hc (Homalodisca coagulata)]MBS0032753.1 single-stranded-DNA-specific exonuclease RecJ [Candidatus Baumannia cicadellinicola]MCJ7462399.1 single-stranded-DNA-specific exonuclease RecJ [Candidatus Baumannia cicadellinicola]MCJ7462790.1 single-stranded-DNA-specific exonuclease RecJ [Candidatus Baumannia cicadellinicola]